MSAVPIRADLSTDPRTQLRAYRTAGRVVVTAPGLRLRLTTEQADQLARSVLTPEPAPTGRKHR